MHIKNRSVNYWAVTDEDFIEENKDIPLNTML